LENALKLHLNGAEQEIEAPPHRTLLELLRDQIGLHSVREGCGIGMCGACTVLVGGKPISACLTLAAMVEGRDVLTVEGLAIGDEANRQLDPLQQAFIDHTGFQCSYCTPGIILSAKALIDENPRATDDEIREYLSGNLCRCGSYVKILDSVRDAIGRLR
jgi:aerobic-type carbon monoxide dehydrogenase small subunit (CoxS/CutS family)